MIDNRSKKLAHTIVNYSLALQKNEKVLIETHGPINAFINELIKSVLKAGALPFINQRQPFIDRVIMKGATKVPFARDVRNGSISHGKDGCLCQHPLP